MAGATTPWRGLFITGTDTGVGKTRVAAAIVRHFVRRGTPVGVLKPVATGVTRTADGWQCEDAQALVEPLSGAIPLERVTPLCYEPPLAPPVAARMAGQTLTMEAVRRAVRESLAWWVERGAEMMVIEGVGGFLCPLADDATVADLAVALDVPVVIVARRSLGTLNHALLTVEAVQRRGLRIAGIVLNGVDPPSNPLAERTNAETLVRCLDRVPILADVPFDQKLEWLNDLIDSINWFDWARPSRYADGSLTHA